MASTRLFKPLKVGRSELSNRIAMAPLTRFRADDNHVPLQPLVSEYYSQRSSVPGTLLVTEATFISPNASGYDNAPGIWSQAQIDSWKKVTDAVHAKKSTIFLQLWALGRVANLGSIKKVAGEGAKVVGASAIPAPGKDTVPTPLTEEEIQEYIRDYTQAAKNAVEAGFDGVEIHSANGYLLDQFIQDVTNQRTDAWGGSIEKRARFPLEVAKSISEAIGGDRTAIRLSPFAVFQGMKMADPRPQFSHVVRELKKYNLAYIHFVESRNDDSQEENVLGEDLRFLVDIWDNQSPVLLAGGFKPHLAVKTVDQEYADKDVIIVFGRYFISTPDIVFRIQKALELNHYDRDT